MIGLPVVEIFAQATAIMILPLITMTHIQIQALRRLGVHAGFLNTSLDAGEPARVTWETWPPVGGVGGSKLEHYGAALLEVVREAA